MLTFPLQMALMTDRAFPLATVRAGARAQPHRGAPRRSRADEALDLEVWAERSRLHRSGATVDLLRERDGGRARRSGAPRSTYLSRGATAPAGAPEADVDVAVGALGADGGHLAGARRRRTPLREGVR